MATADNRIDETELLAIVPGDIFIWRGVGVIIDEVYPAERVPSGALIRSTHGKSEHGAGFSLQIIAGPQGHYRSQLITLAEQAPSIEEAA